LSQPADQTIDANGITAIPGLIDSHSHPSIGEYTPAQNSLGWITNYMHGGVTSLISAGELHLPGLPLPPDARTALSVAIVTKKCYDNLRPSGVKVHAGTLLLVPGLE
jgi:enamidase